MPSIRINTDNKNQMHFVTCTVKNWYYLFDRHSRFQLLSDSLKYCQQQKGLQIYAYVLMLNHLHFIAKAPDLAQVLCDFKKFTSRELMKNMLATEPNVAELFTSKNGKQQIWQSTNYPQIIETEEFFRQKKSYIENNPVKKEYVERIEYWKYSSANPNSPLVVSTIE